MWCDLQVTRGIKVLSNKCSIINVDCDAESFREFGELEMDLMYRAQESDIIRRREMRNTPAKEI
jgi:hypothetical protein